MFYLPSTKGVRLLNFGSNQFGLDRYDATGQKVRTEAEVKIDREYIPLEKELVRFQKEIDIELGNMRRRIKEKIHQNDGEFETTMYRNISSHASTKLNILKERKSIVDKKLDFKMKLDKLDGGSISDDNTSNDAPLISTTYNAPQTNFSNVTGIHNNTPDENRFKKEPPIVSNEDEPPVTAGFKKDPINNMNYELALNNLKAKEKNIEVALHLTNSGKYWLSYEDNGVEVEGISKKRILALRPLSIDKATMTAIDGGGSTYKLVSDDERNMPDYYKEQWDAIQEF